MQNIRIGIDVSIVPGGGDVEEPGQVAVLEDPHHRPERRRQAERVEHQRLDRHEHAAREQEQQHRRRHDDDRQGQRQPRRDRRLGVDELGGLAADGDVERGVDGAHVPDQRLALRRDDLDRRHDGEADGAVRPRTAPPPRTSRPRRGLRRRTCRPARRRGRRRRAPRRRRRGRRRRRTSASSTPSTTTGNVSAALPLKPSRSCSLATRDGADSGSTRSSGAPNATPQERRAEEQQHGHDADGDEQRPAHDAPGRAVPEAVLLGLAGAVAGARAGRRCACRRRSAARAGRRSRRPSPAARRRCRRRRTSAGSTAGTRAARRARRRRSGR